MMTIGELSGELGVAQHILRYWETRFPQLRPMQRAGNRRYYRPADVELAQRIHRLLNHEGYTVRGVQKLLKDRIPARSPSSLPAALSSVPTHLDPPVAEPVAMPEPPRPSLDIARLIAIRDALASAIELSEA